MYFFLHKEAINKNYKIPFNPNKTILIHLRLEDVSNRIDYDGSICNNFYKNKLNNDEWYWYDDFYETCNRQAPINYNRLNELITNVKQKYYDYEVVFITSPDSNTENIPYRVIKSNDINLDLYYLTQSYVLILSRSMFSIVSSFIGISRETYIPLWGHITCMGISTKYDNSVANEHIYFY
jgi:hypothetical protein